MIDTDKYESMRRLFLDFIDTASDEVDEEAWRNKLTMLDELLAEVKRLREEVEQMRVLKIVKENERLREELRILNGMNNALWNTVENYDICLDDFTMIDLLSPPDGYEYCEDELRWVKKND